MITMDSTGGEWSPPAAASTYMNLVTPEPVEPMEGVRV